jgi:hypothetical protein
MGNGKLHWIPRVQVAGWLPASMGMVVPVRILSSLRNGKHGRLERADGQGCGEAGPSARFRACGLQEMSAEAYMRQQPLSQVCHLGAV